MATERYNNNEATAIHRYAYEAAELIPDTNPTSAVDVRIGGTVWAAPKDAQRHWSDYYDNARQKWRPSLGMEQRAGIELAELIASPVYYGIGIPRGDGRTIMPIPGFLGSDQYLSVLRGWLKRTGYTAEQSGISVHAGSLSRIMDNLEDRCEQIANKNGSVTIIGHSLGGVVGRAMAVRRPDLIEHVITYGSPHGKDASTCGHFMVQGLAEAFLTDKREAGAPLLEHMGSPLPEGVRLDSIYTREDAVVDYEACIDYDPRATCHEVTGTHGGLAWNASVYRKTANILAG